MPRVLVATHGHCFDGMCSAVMFTRLYRHLRKDGASFAYHGAGYGPGQNGVEGKALTGDVNAILDFRFSAVPQLSWYFDHHQTAFVTPGDRAFFDARADETSKAGERHFFYDGHYGSCTKLIADVAREAFGLDTARDAELVRWADIIDTASFPSAQMAVERAEPELRLMTVIEHTGDDAFLARMVPRLLEEPLADVARSADVAKAYEPLGKAHATFIESVRARAVEIGHVVLVDLSGEVLEVAGKFVTYALHPQSAYSVMLTRSKSKLKISIGYNPWSGATRLHNIAAICERHGGGGHAVVGAISLSLDRLEEAKVLSRSIAEELAGPPAPQG